jgi:ATP-binding cassette subfamily B protein
MKNIQEYIQSVRFALSYSFRFVPKATFVMFGLYIFSGALPYGNAYLLGKLVNTILASVGSGVNTDVYYVLILYALITALPTIVGNIQLYVNRHSMLTLQMETDIDILGKREKIDIAQYEDPKFQDLLQRAFRNGSNPIYMLISTQFTVVRTLTSLILGTVLAIQFNMLVYIVVIATAIPGFFTDIRYAGQSWSIYAKDSPEQRRLSDLRDHIKYRIPLIETKLLQSGKKLLAWIRDIMSHFATNQLGLEKKRLLHSSLSDAIALFGFATGLFLVVKSVVSGNTQVGTLVYMMSTLSTVRNSIGALLESISGQYENHLIVKDMQKVLQTKPIIIESKNPVSLDLKKAPDIVFEKVSFKYPHAEQWSVRNISLTMTSGNKIGLVGNNGAGKTTLVKLLCRIYEPTEGRILINGIDLRDVSTKEWWSYLGIMFQEYANYDFSVKEAIAIGRPDAPARLDRVVDAAHTAQAHTFIEEWKDSYNQQLGVEFGGKEPSKGQRQKLSIAKTIYRNGFIMILDEPTASVDAESEAKIFDSLESLSKDITALLISHDFSTISQCDQIFVLEKGTLIEEGNHKALMKMKGVYAELYSLQAERFKK